MAAIARPRVVTIDMTSETTIVPAPCMRMSSAAAFEVSQCRVTRAMRSKEIGEACSRQPSLLCSSQGRASSASVAWTRGCPSQDASQLVRNIAIALPPLRARISTDHCICARSLITVFTNRPRR